MVAFATAGIAVLAGVYFPLSVLPEWLGDIARALPFSWALDLLRDCLLGGDPSVEQAPGPDRILRSRGPGIAGPVLRRGQSREAHRHSRAVLSDSEQAGTLRLMRDATGLVHDYLLMMRGAERTFAAIAESWPHAPIVTTLYSQDGTDGRFSGR